MEIVSLTSGYMESHCYQLVENGHAVVIDPGDAGQVLAALSAEHLQADFGILTHEHCDHIFGCTELREKLGIPFYASSICNRNMQDTRKNFSRYFDAFVAVQTKVTGENRKEMPRFSANADRCFDDKLTVEWQGHRFNLQETPGHSEGSICILVDQSELFVGDTLLADDLTGLRYAGSSREQLLEKTLPWLRSLPGEIRTWPGHGPGFLLGERLLKPVVADCKSKGEQV